MDVDMNTIRQRLTKNYFSLIKDEHFKNIKGFKVQDDSRVAICLCANKKYIEGAKTAIYSIRQNNENVPTIILLSNDIEEAFEGVDILLRLDTDDYRHMDFTGIFIPGVVWQKEIFYKLSVFNIYGYDRIVFIDSDMLVVSDISDLWNLEKYNELDFYATCSTPQFVDREKDSKKHYSSALMVINKNLLNTDVYKEMLGMASLHKSYDGSDQGVINYYIAKKSIRGGTLNQYYNTYVGKDAVYKHKEGEMPERILHFVGGWLEIESWNDRIHQKINKQKYVDLYDRYWQAAMVHVRISNI